MPDYFVHDDVLNASLDYLKTNTTKIVLCDAGPTTYSDANTNNGTSTGMKLAEVTTVSGDFTISDGPVDGRKVQVAAKNGVSVVAAGNGTHVAWLDTVNSKLLAVTLLSVSRDGLIVADTVDIPAHAVRARDAVVAS